MSEMRLATLDDLRQFAKDAKETLQQQAESVGRGIQIYLHWSAGRYEPNAVDLADYHVLILDDGSLLVREVLSDSIDHKWHEDLDEALAHTWHRNTGAVGVALACCFGASTAAFGDFPPTKEQIESMAQVIAVLAEGLELPIDPDTVMTHAEAADLDGYGPATTCERWDLWLLGPGQAGGSGGDILRGKAIWYQQQRKEV